MGAPDAGFERAEAQVQLAACQSVVREAGRWAVQGHVEPSGTRSLWYDVISRSCERAEEIALPARSGRLEVK